MALFSRQREIPECFADAAEILAEWHHPCSRVISVDRDSILFLNSLGKPRTAWIHRPPDGSGVRLRCQDGFIATPPEG